MKSAHDIYEETARLWNPDRVKTIRELGGELIKTHVCSLL